MAMVRLRSGVVLALLLPMMGIGLAEPPDEVGASKLKSLSLEELMNVEITSVSKRPEKLVETPAAVSVITSEDIRRSGVTNIPDALRMAPGVQVARIDSNKWAVGMRGFASRNSRSMLALMDGRSLYTPLFSGVYWEVQDTFLEDVDRIEVIRGPGGTLWGANAVNGVINIITKSAKETQGAVVTGGGGSEEQGFGGFRYGGKLGQAVNFRVYGQYFNRDAGLNRNGPNFDGWDMGRVGFRTDSDLTTDDALTVQGDLYDGSAGQRGAITAYSPPFLEPFQKDNTLSGGNLLGRWTRRTGETSELAVQMYYDHTFRREAEFHERRDTYDADLQHRFLLPWRQEIVWGLGYRLSADETDVIPTAKLIPASRQQSLFSAFVQDEITLIESRLRLTMGSKFEHNDFSGFEAQPSLRLLWTPAASHVVWASVTRAVRTPSLIETGWELTELIDPRTPAFARIIGDGRFVPENVLSYELGYRVEPVRELFFDLTGFYSRDTKLESFEIGSPFRESSPPPERVVVPYFIRNKLDGDLYGAELSSEAAVLDWWRLGTAYSFLEISLQKEAGSHDPTVATTEKSSPHHQVSLRSVMDLPGRTELDGWLRYVDNLPGQRVGSYVNLDLRCGWHPTRNLEVSVVGQNLIQDHHLEFPGTSGTSGSRVEVEVERSAYGRVTWRW